MARVPDSLERAAFRAEVVAAVLTEIELVGAKALSKNAVAKRFEGRGASPSTVYRWVDAVVKSGRAGQHLARKVKDAVAERAARSPDPAAEAARDAATKLPVVVTPDDIAGGGGTVNVIGRLQDCIKAAEDVMQHARIDTGGVRMAKTLLAASEHLRHCLETCGRLYEAMRGVAEVDRFHAAILEEVARESPECAERIAQRLALLSGDYGA
ncbi:hypothetical protein EJV46_05870 [Roseococcus sp. SYP-B2431]|uniref:hypothetical protein n=1 Tax=Roseococcus sp. SYP-B2431 TaxID=2496640 RepID=UPI00103A6F78|nr:hypothetical protein [Roseococcus sp. SYP-B2431]TCI00177.1 hypothetical protein EJV46_05870 [Roseococcus sp. SYP-B2431]